MSGINGDYNLEEVLGPKFKEFVTLLQASSVQPFTIGALKPDLVRTYPNIYKQNDISSEFTESLINITAAFNKIENSNNISASLDSQSSQSNLSAVKKFVSDLLAERIPLEDNGNNDYVFDFLQLPHTVDNLSMLFPLFHLLPYNPSIYPKTDIDPHNGLINAIRYLYHYIALLDLDDTDAEDIIPFLRNDKLYFARYIDQIVDTFSKNYSDINTNKDDFYRIIYKGMEEITRQIIIKFKSLPDDTTINVDDIVNPLKVLQNRSTTFSLVDMLSQFNLPSGQIKVLGDYFDIFQNRKITDFIGDQMSPPINKRKELTEYLYNSLMNPIYLDTEIFKKSINNLNTIILKGGKNNRRSRNHAGGANKTDKIWHFPQIPSEKFESLPELYGPPNNNIAYLVTLDQIENINGSYIVDDQIVKSILHYDLIKNEANGFIPIIVEMFGSSVDNVYRVAILSIFYYLIDNDIDVTTMGQRSNDLIGFIGHYLFAYKIIHSRLNEIPVSDYADHFDYLIEPFVKKINNDIEKLASFKQDVKSKTSNLSDPQIRNFYKEVIAKDAPFYDTFFNLIRNGQTSVSEGAGYNPVVHLIEASKITNESDWDKYRLNVKKYRDLTSLFSDQVGGRIRGDDIVFTSLIPDYSSSVYGGLWLPNNIYIPRETLETIGTDALRYIPRQVYQVSPRTGQSDIYGYNIQIPTFLATGLRPSSNVINRLFPSNDPYGSLNIPPYGAPHPGNTWMPYVSASALTSTVPPDGTSNMSDYMKKILNDISTVPVLSAIWKEGEINFSEHLLKQASKWERIDDDFVLKDENGNIIDSKPEDNCKFIETSTQECLDFFNGCLGKNEKDFALACANMLDFDFNINPAINVLTVEVSKINPKIAFAILKQFKFGAYLVEEKEHPFPGFRRIKVQSVGSWLEDLITGSDRCARPTGSNNDLCDNRPLYDQLSTRYNDKSVADIIIEMARDPTKQSFFNYLDVLVQWVNANPQVLNPEEDKDPRYGAVHQYPPVNESFKNYQYINPYKPARLRMRNIVCELDRLKGNIIHDLSGARGVAMVSTINQLPQGLSMPFSREGFAHSNPLLNLGNMFGGNTINTTINSLSNLNSQYGSYLFGQIYDDLRYTMDSLKGDKKFKLGDSSSIKIMEKLEKLRKAEDDLRKKFVEFITKKQLYEASHGHVNAFKIDNEQNFNSVLAKHSNLLKLSSEYNKRTIDFISVLQTIANIIISKIDPSKTDKYHRPLTMGYHNADELKKTWGV